MGIYIAARQSAPPAPETTAERVDRFGLRVRLPDNRLVTGAQLAAIPTAELKRLGVDPRDLWHVLAEAATADNEGQVLDLRARTAKTRYAITDGVDGNYDNAVRPNARGGVVFAREAVTLDDTRERPGWFLRALRAIGDFFIELFTLTLVDTYTFNDKNKPLEYEERGRRLAERMPATMRAVLDQPNGREDLRALLLAQRPERVSESTWREIVDGVMSGIDAAIEESVKHSQFTDGLPSLLARDHLLQAWRRAGNDADRRAVVEIATLLRTGFSPATVEAIAEGMASGSTGLDWRRLAQALGPYSPLARGDMVRALSSLPPKDQAAFFALIEGETFRTRLGDVDRRLYLDAWVRPQNASYRQGLLDIVSSETWKTTAAETRQAIIRLFTGDASDEERDHTLKLLAGASFRNATPAERTLLIGALAGQGESATEFLAAVPRIMELEPTARAGFLEMFATEPFEARHLDILSVTFPAEGLQHVLFGQRDLRLNETGQEMVIVQRYLQALGFSRTVGVRNRPVFDAEMQKAVREFQTQEGLAATGAIDRATLVRMMVRLPYHDPPDNVGFTHPRYTTELSIDRPTATTDGPWNATRRWDAAEEQRYEAFASAYMRARIDTGEELDCADLAYETLIMFARQRGLPIALNNGSVRITHRSRAPVTATVRGAFAAAHVPRYGNTVPVTVAEARVSDIGIMRWAQAVDGHDGRYHHTYNILGWSTTDTGETFLIYGSLEDEVKQSALDAYKKAHGLTLSVKDVPEDSIIDAITNDQDRGVSKDVQVARVRQLLARFSETPPTDAQVEAFIAMIADESNILRDQPTVIYTRAGEGAFAAITGRDLFADEGLAAAAVTSLNASHPGLSLRTGETVSSTVTYRRYFPVEGVYREVTETISVKGDLQLVLSAPDETQALRIARERAVARGATEANADAWARDIVAATNGTRRLRRWNFAGFNAAI